MPGIVGLITRMPESQAREELALMMAAMSREAFYVTGCWADASLGVYVGWTGREGSSCAAMPIRNECANVTMVFSGQDHSGCSVAGGLRARGHRFRESGPEYLAHLYEDDPEFPAGLDGTFQGVVADGRVGRATLFNDRYGLERIYVLETPEATYFAAEAKAILAVRPEERSLNLQSLGEFVSCGCVLEDRTLFRNIRLLPPASAWIFRQGRLESRRRYFDARAWEEQEPLSPDAYYELVRGAVRRCVPQALNGNAPVALAVTGGLDTRVILAWSQARPGLLPCYTFGGSIRESHDVRIGRQVAAACGQRHHVIGVAGEFLSQFGRYAERTTYLSEGCVSVANAPDLYVSAIARTIAPAKVVGTWGSELLRHSPTFKPAAALPGLYDRELLEQVRRAETTYARVRQGHAITFAAFRQTPWAQYGIEALEQTQIEVRAPFLSNEFVRAVYRAPDLSQADIRARLIRDGNPALAAIPSDRGASIRPAGALATANRLLSEFSFKCEYAWDMGMPQWLACASHAIRPLSLDRLFLGRHKFSHFRSWYRGVLANYVREILLDPVTLTRPFLRRDAVRTLVEQHTQGCRNHTTTIHTLLTLELLQRQFI